MNSRSVALTTSCLLLMSAPTLAQEPLRLGPQPPDTTLARPLIDKVFDVMAIYIGRAASDTTVKPWRIELPQSESYSRSVRDHLLVALRARPAIHGDSFGC